MDYQGKYTDKIFGPEATGNLNKNKETLNLLIDTMFKDLREKGPAKIACGSGAVIAGENMLSLDYFGKPVIVDIENMDVFYRDDSEPLTRVTERINREDMKFADTFSTAIILHYLSVADGAPITGEWISYRELPGGLFYSGTMPPVIAPLIKKYQENGEDFVNRALKIGGRVTGDNKYGVVVYPFIRFPVMVILDEMDEEFGASIRLLFDKNSPHY
ncbi:MAG: DUF3786 domain-containing protein, partial [Actinobacteria bacterium]|nr:DUF3786 domain-containing protein [Actinomycetota bacterium]